MDPECDQVGLDHDATVAVAALSASIRQIHTASRGTYGVPRIHAELADAYETRCGRKRLARLMRAAGLVGVNVGVAAPMVYFPFSGAKESFFGTLHAQGQDGIRFYTESKVVITRWF